MVQSDIDLIYALLEPEHFKHLEARDQGFLVFLRDECDFDKRLATKRKTRLKNIAIERGLVDDKNSGVPGRGRRFLYHSDRHVTA